ncbi:MAG: glutathione peroxidase [Alistipes sp.]|nr:glutathione peroxidase [Alistipes sp.]
MDTRIKACCSAAKGNKNLYDFEVMAVGNKRVSLADYKGKVVLVVNTASKCGFTPQYADLQALYAKYKGRGLEILDFPCNQFGGQSPESDSETVQFCQLNYGTEFPQFKKVEVNGANELPLYTWLKAERGFEGFDEGHNLAPVLDKMLREADADYDKKSDIKWNFTKFLIDREGRVVARFEPTADMARIEEAIERLL